MDRTAVWSVLLSELCNTLPFVERQNIKPADRFINIGASSLDRIDLAISISERLGLKDDDEDITSLAFTNTVEEFLDILCIRKTAADIKKPGLLRQA